jgi:menaquinone-dependent protoporphyrinogen IX oxidase
MKGIVIFDTSHGNTRTIASTIAETLKESAIEADSVYLKDIKKLSTKDYNFLIFGSPTKFGTMSLAMRFFLGKVKSQEWMNRLFAAFDTENPENIEKQEGSAAEKIAAKLKEKQMKQLSPVLKSAVSGMRGPLQEGEIERARDYARKLAAELKANSFQLTFKD